MTHAKTAITWLIRLVLVAFLALVVGAITVLIVIPRATHAVALDVLTGSMTPNIPVGSVVIERPVDPGTLHVGDVATYQVKPGVDDYITHRIVAINTKTNPVTFTFKGDANRGPDIKPVPATAIRGKVWFHVPYLGEIRDGLKGAFGRALLLVVAMVVLGGFAIKQFYDVFRERRRKHADDGLAPLCLQFALDAFGEVDPSFVADLFHGECEVGDDGTFRLSFRAAPERIAVIRDLLAPHGIELSPEKTESSETEAAETAAVHSDAQAGELAHA